LGVILIAQGLQGTTPAVPALAGGLVVLNAAIVEGPLGAFRAVNRRQHRVLDVILITTLLVVAVLPMLNIDASSRVLIAPELRASAGLVRDVMLLGMGSHFELWDAQRHAEHEAAVMASPMPDSLKQFAF